jgi:hypothetical protein
MWGGRGQIRRWQEEEVNPGQLGTDFSPGAVPSWRCYVGRTHHFQIQGLRFTLLANTSGCSHRWPQAVGRKYPR